MQLRRSRGSLNQPRSTLFSNNGTARRGSFHSYNGLPTMIMYSYFYIY
uniref:Uncharacterized protein n=1 Tax=Anguilla anguilla TaxID=7936 RepID=A0A0E9XVL9_ANGAN